MLIATNQHTCGQCENFDPVLRGQSAKGGLRETVWGWCSKRSIYPAYEGPGQKFPDEVERAEPGELARPFIVRKNQVVMYCTEHETRKSKPCKADLLKQLQAPQATEKHA